MHLGIIFLADYLVLLPVALAAWVVASQLAVGKRRILAEVCLAVGVALVLQLLLRHIFPSVRPYILNDSPALIPHPPTTNSFPSGHTITAFVAATIVCFWSKKWGGLALVAAVLVGVGRVLARVHWPIDILGGVIVALVAVVVAHRLSRLLPGE